MRWCDLLNMWCFDIEESEKDAIGCDGDCRHCENSTAVM